jgi:N-acetylneuraminic acid mutarotase
VSDGKTIDGTGPGSFTSSIIGLTPNTTYHVRAYATNSEGTAYGNEFFFTANQIAAATLTTTEISDITTASAVSGGNIISNGGATVTDWGVCWSTHKNPTTSDEKYSIKSGTSGLGIFISNLTVLNQGTSYFVRAYAVNSAGTAYGNEISFSSQFTVTTSAIVAYTANSAVVTSNVISDQNGSHLIGSGVCWSTSQNTTTADSKTINDTYSGNFRTYLTGLAQGTTYFVRAYALYDNGPAIYGNELSFTTAYEPGTGQQKADFPGGARYSTTGFSIGSKIYIGLGNDGDVPMRDFWEWDQATNVWIRKADFPGNSSGGEIGFSIGIKGYIEAGSTNEFWEYDPSTNNWSQKSSRPGTLGIANCVAFTIGSKGYIGTGYINDGYDGAFSQEFWEWDQVTNIWMKKANFPGNERSNAVGFSIGNKGYIGTGSGQGSISYTDFWEWDQAKDAWTRKADFAGAARQSAVGFSIGNKGYIGTGLNYSISGTKKDFWEWDQATNTWTKKADFAGSSRAWAVGFSIGNKGYVGSGSGSDTNNFGIPLQDLWEYDPTLK